MSSALLLADLGDVAVTVSAVLVTASVAVYAVKNRGGTRHGAWWRSVTGWHLMSYMAALAWVLDQGVIYMLTTTGILLRHAPPFRLDWFAWERVISFLVLITFVFAWRLVLIIRPPRLPGDGKKARGRHEQ